MTIIVVFHAPRYFYELIEAMLFIMRTGKAVVADCYGLDALIIYVGIAWIAFPAAEGRFANFAVI